MAVVTQNTLILVYYINVDAFSSVADKIDYINQVKDTVQNEGCYSIVLPVSDEPTRIECLNPKYLSSEEYKRIENNIEEADKRLKKFLISFNPNNNTKY